MRRAKIVCTLGPACSTPERIGALIDAGMNVARLNFSHGEHAEHERLFNLVRAEAAKRNAAIAVLQDVQGPKLRVGRFVEGEAKLDAGAEFIVTTRDEPGDSTRVSTTYKNLPNDVKPGDTILLDDGYLQLEVISVEGPEVKTCVVIGGLLKNNKGMNLPGVHMSVPALTDKDKVDIAFGLRLGVDLIALSFVRGPEDVLEAKRLTTLDDRRIPIIAKLEKPEAVDALEAIIEAADGIMIARGDLGVELGPEKVPLIQKRAITLTNQQGKVVITATQMLESMIENPRPTRAEASDVANAVLDGTDALMLSGETAVGRYPVAAVRTMGRIIEEIESSIDYSAYDSPNLDFAVNTNAIAHAAVVAAEQLRTKVIAVYTESGGSARLISEYRTDAMIVALTTDERTYRGLALYWGVIPELIAPAVTTDEMFDRIEDTLKQRGMASSGDRVIISMGVPIGGGESTNLLKIHRVS